MIGSDAARVSSQSLCNRETSDDSWSAFVSPSSAALLSASAFSFSFFIKSTTFSTNAIFS